MNEVRHRVEEGNASVGATLRAAREARGLTLDDIGRETRVPMRHLVQIEEDRLDGLPAAPYSAGFVKAYARAVGLDPNAAALQFRAEFDRAHSRSPRPHYEPYEPADPVRLPPRLLAIVAAVIAVALIAGYAIWRSGVVTGNGPAERARLAAGSSDAVPAAPAAPQAIPRPAAAPAQDGGGMVRLTATQPVWMKVSERNGATLFMGTLPQGQSYDVPLTAADPVIRTGRPEAIAVSVGGRPVAPLGAPAHTVSNMSLKADALLGRPASAIERAPEPAHPTMTHAPAPDPARAAPPPAAAPDGAVPAAPAATTGGGG